MKHRDKSPGDDEKTLGRGIQSIEVGARILTALMQTGTPMMLRDIAAAAEIIPAQGHAYLASLRRVELVEQESGTGRYLLGPAAARLAIARMRGTPMLSNALREVRALSDAVGLMTAVVIWGPDAPTAVQVHEGAQSLNINIRAGTTFSVTGSATGRIFGAFSGRPEVQARIESEFAGGARKTVGLAATHGDFLAEMSTIRTAGYSCLVNSPFPGLCSLSAPVMRPDGELALALTLIGNTEGLDLTVDGRPVQTLLDTARRLSAPSELVS